MRIRFDRLAIAAILALGLCLVGTAPVAAHPRFTPQVGEPDQPVTLALAVDSHVDAAVTSVVIEVPEEEFRLDRTVAAPGWTEQPSTGGSLVRFTGRLVPGTVASFIVAGSPQRKGIIHFPVTTTDELGASVHWDGHCDTDAPYKAAFLFSGVVEDCEAAGGGDSPLLPIGVALIVAGIAGIVGYTLVIRRR